MPSSPVIKDENPIDSSIWPRQCQKQGPDCFQLLQALVQEKGLLEEQDEDTTQRPIVLQYRTDGQVNGILVKRAASTTSLPTGKFRGSSDNVAGGFPRRSRSVRFDGAPPKIHRYAMPRSVVSSDTAAAEKGQKAKA
ncbi:hypothetical protein DFQ30_010354 [Apophysomyces sp. BC1015]|nr:hypothetical protein DFQ30_010354 [Apophysomyces sp. BC1015]